MNYNIFLKEIKLNIIMIFVFILLIFTSNNSFKYDDILSDIDKRIIIINLFFMSSYYFCLFLASTYIRDRESKNLYLLLNSSVSKTNIYISKFLAGLFITFIVFIISTLTFFIKNDIFIDPNFKNMIPGLLESCFLAFLVIFCLGCITSFLFQISIFGIYFNFKMAILYSIIYPIYNLISARPASLSTTKPETIQQYINKYLPVLNYFMPGNIDFKVTYIIIPILSILFFVLGLIIFNKKDQN